MVVSGVVMCTTWSRVIVVSSVFYAWVSSLCVFRWCRVHNCVVLCACSAVCVVMFRVSRASPAHLRTLSAQFNARSSVRLCDLVREARKRAVMFAVEVVELTGPSVGHVMALWCEHELVHDAVALLWMLRDADHVRAVIRAEAMRTVDDASYFVCCMLYSSVSFMMRHLEVDCACAADALLGLSETARAAAAAKPPPSSLLGS